MTCSAVAVGSRAPRAIARLCAKRSVTPGTYSMAMKYRPSSCPKSKTCTMLGWLSRPAIAASATNICTSSARCWSAVSIVLMTIRRSNPAAPVTRARQTSAIPPVASRESIT